MTPRVAGQGATLTVSIPRELKREVMLRAVLADETLSGYVCRILAREVEADPLEVTRGGAELAR